MLTIPLVSKAVQLLDAGNESSGVNLETRLTLIHAGNNITTGRQPPLRYDR